jgi:hypothetical protein
MGLACTACGGASFGHIDETGFVDDGIPCSKCNADGIPKKPGSLTTTKSVEKRSLEWVDKQGSSTIDDEGVTTAHGEVDPAMYQRMNEGGSA